MRRQDGSLHDLLDPVLDANPKAETGTWSLRGIVRRLASNRNVSLPGSEGTPFVCSMRSAGSFRTWARYHRLGASSSSDAVHSALIRDLKIETDPVLMEASLRILSHKDDPAAALAASRKLCGLGRRVSVPDVLESADRLSPYHVPSEHSPDRGAWPATKLLSQTRGFCRATGARHEHLMWMREIDPRLWYCVRAGFGAHWKSIPAFGLAAASHWGAESQAGTPLPVPRLGKAVSMVTDWLSGFVRDDRPV